MSTPWKILSVLMLLFLAMPAAAQETRDGARCQACSAPVPRLGLRLESAWSEVRDDAQPWAETLTVTEVVVDSPAHLGGVEAGDIVLRVNELVATSQLFWSLRRTIQPGDSLRFLVEREGAERELTLVVPADEGS